MSKIVACIMAGGVGSRFWPASVEERPKQFLDILGIGRSLLQLTYDRYVKIGLSPDDIWVVTNEIYVDQVQKHLPDVPSDQIIGEPLRKNTAPAAYLGNKLIREKVGDATIIMAPSDHHIEDIDVFNDVIQTGKQLLDNTSALITIGIKPTFPHTGYGYIAYLRTGEAPYKVSNFTEKPDLEKATEFVKSGDYLWNAGIFMWTTSSLDEAFSQYAPRIKEIIDRELVVTDGVIDKNSIHRAFEQLEDASIDYEIMERADNVYTIPASFQWSDLGSWKSLFDESEKDTNNNVLVASNTLMDDAFGNLVFAPGKRVVVNGLKNFMIIEDNDTIVISPIDKNQEVKIWRQHFVSNDK